MRSEGESPVAKGQRRRAVARLPWKSADLSPGTGPCTHTVHQAPALTGNMRAILHFLSSLLILATLAAGSAAERQRVSLDSDWKFALADARGAEQPAFPDAGWRTLNVPHDWSIEGAFAETNSTGGAGGFLPAGVGWYRKHFTVPAGYAGLRVRVVFDGVMANSNVWLNGVHLGHRPNGYVSFCYDLSAALKAGPGQTNVLAVRADNSAQPASRWYAGAGIYRHVWLLATEPVHIDLWGSFVTTPEVKPDSAQVRLQTTVLNESTGPKEISVQSLILSPAGQIAQTEETKAQLIEAGRSAAFEQTVAVKAPRFWSPEQPVLYRSVTSVRSGGIVLDAETNFFGIREARFEPATGLWLNGKNLKLKGVCLHHDGGALGAAVPLGIWEDRLKLLKQVGCNAIRTAHNPPAPEFLDLCDRLGFLVMDEMFDCWTVGKNRNDYHLYFNEWSKTDTRDTVRRDRNHPSVILYSAGNEIRDTPRAELAKTILSGLIEVFHREDSTRPVTQALFRPNVSHDYENGLADLLDVIGQNYRENELLAAHAAKPSRKIVGTENGHDRGIWLALRDNPPYAGQFLWTGFDYLGESRRWPVVGAGSGLFDRTGQPRPRAFQRQSWWSDRPMVHIVRRVEPERATPADPGFDPLTRRPQEFSDWTPARTEPHDEQVEVYSNCEQVELLLNGKSLGTQPLPADASPRAWKVSFELGSLAAVGRNNGQVAATFELRTAGRPARIRLTARRADLVPEWDDVACVRAEIVDRDGVLVPNARDLVSFKVSGPGVLAAVDSGDNASHEPFRAGARRAYQGSCIAILKAGGHQGSVTLVASAPGLVSDSITLPVR